MSIRNDFSTSTTGGRRLPESGGRLSSAGSAPPDARSARFMPCQGRFRSLEYEARPRRSPDGRPPGSSRSPVTPWRQPPRVPETGVVVSFSAKPTVAVRAGSDSARPLGPAVPALIRMTTPEAAASGLGWHRAGERGVSLSMIPRDPMTRRCGASSSRDGLPEIPSLCGERPRPRTRLRIVG